MIGLRKAMEAMQESSSSIAESAAWLNLMISRVWRVKLTKHSDQTKILQDVMIPEKSDSICSCSKESHSCGCDDNGSFGGLEPLISYYLGELLIDSMRSTSDMQPDDVTYISLDSFTLGRTAPVVRSVKIKNVHEVDHVVKLSLDVDALLEDSNIVLGKCFQTKIPKLQEQYLTIIFLLQFLCNVLDIKLSSLDYALLPSTKLSINSLDVQAPVELTITFSPTYPYVSTLNITMEEMPKYKFRIMPSSESRSVHTK